VILLEWKGHTRCLCIGVCTQQNFYNSFTFKRKVEREEQKSGKEREKPEYNKKRTTVCTNFNSLSLQHILFGFGQWVVVANL